MNPAQKELAKSRATTVFAISFLIAGIFGGVAYHFLVGSGYFAGLEVNTSLWGGIALVIATPASIICGACFWRAVSLQEVK